MKQDTPTYKREHLVPLKQAEKRGLVVGYDCAGYINAAYRPTPFLIDMLLDKRVIKDDHHFYGVQMISLRKVFLDPMRTKTGMLQVKQDDEASPDKPIPIEDTDYLKVLREIRNQRWKEIIMAVCAEEADADLYGQLARVEGSVCMAFGNLCDAIIALWQQKKCRQECGEFCVGLCK